MKPKQATTNEITLKDRIATITSDSTTFEDKQKSIEGFEPTKDLIANKLIANCLQIRVTQLKPNGTINKLDSSTLSNMEVVLEPKLMDEVREILEQLNLLKGKRSSTSDTPNILEIRNNFRLWLKQQYNLGLVEKCDVAMLKHKTKFVCFDSQGVKKTISINIGNSDKTPK